MANKQADIYETPSFGQIQKNIWLMLGFKTWLKRLGFSIWQKSLEKTLLKKAVLALFLDKIAANNSCFPFDSTLVVVTLLNNPCTMKHV